MRALSLQLRVTRRRRAALLGTAVICVLLALWFAAAVPPQVARAAAPPRLLWIADNGGYRHVACDDVAVGMHLTLFTCGATGLTPADAGTLVRAFDRRIYPTDVRAFGTPRGLKTVNVVMAPFSGMTFGYFDENDLNPEVTSATTHSNHGNFLYVRSIVSMPDANRMMDVQEALAHELQHLIDYRMRVLDRGLEPEDVWLNEGLSFYAQLANGFWTPHDSVRVEASAADPGWSVTAMSENSQFLQQHGRVAYGRAGMFVTYLAAQGGDRFTRDLVRQTQTGMLGIDAVLRGEHRGTCAGAFAHWGVAQLLNRPGTYGYGSVLGDHFVEPHLIRPPVTSYPFDSQLGGHGGITLPAWTQGYLRFETIPGATITVRLSGTTGVRVAAIYSAHASGGVKSVRWLTSGPGGIATLQLLGSNAKYDEVTVALSAVGPLRDTSAARHPADVRVQASSVYARHDQRMSRAAASAGHDAHLAV